EVEAVALAAREHADALLLVRSAEVERSDVGTRVDLASSDLHPLLAAADLLPDRLLGVEPVARLVDVGELHRLAEPQRARVGLLHARDHAKQRRLAGTVAADHA